jgi:hypothetical protein
MNRGKKKSMFRQKEEIPQEDLFQSSEEETYTADQKSGPKKRFIQHLDEGERYYGYGFTPTKTGVSRDEQEVSICLFVCLFGYFGLTHNKTKKK